MKKTELKSLIQKAKEQDGIGLAYDTVYNYCIDTEDKNYILYLSENYSGYFFKLELIDQNTGEIELTSDKMPCAELDEFITMLIGGNKPLLTR